MSFLTLRSYAKTWSLCIGSTNLASQEKIQTSGS